MKISKNLKSNNFKTIYLAGGCFWGVEEYFKRFNGIELTEVGYANGLTGNTNYQNISKTDHAETVKIIYNSEITSLENILVKYFNIINPTILNRQGNDIGRQYRTGIYYTDEIDLNIIKNFISKIQNNYSSTIVVEVEKLKNFVKAEDYHQDYLEKNPNGYCHINIKDIEYDKPYVDKNKYSLPSKEWIKSNLTNEEYLVTQENYTEKPYINKYNNSFEKGIYVDIVTGEPLFLSKDKYNSGCGWPAFSKPIDEEVVKYHEDNKLKVSRTEVRSRIGDSHLGHVFEDGPKEMGGLRYCINSASLKFIPEKSMEKEGYGEFLKYL